MSRKQSVCILQKGLRIILLGAICVLQFAGAVEPISAAGRAPEIGEGDSVSLMISKNATPYSFSLSLHASDADIGETLSWSIPILPTHSAGYGVSGSPGTTVNVSYQPAVDYVGTDTFAVQVSDGSLTDSITIHVLIGPEVGLVFAAAPDDHGRNDILDNAMDTAESTLGITANKYYPADSSAYQTELVHSP